MSDNKIKKITIAVLICCILVMSIAYANLFEQLMINGNASVAISWKVEITGIKEGNKTAGASSKGIPSFTTNSAKFDVELMSFNDSIEYLITIKNNGDVDAKLDNIESSRNGSDAIVYEIIGVKENDVIKKGESVVVTVRIRANHNMEIDEDKLTTGMTLYFNYSQIV